MLKIFDCLEYFKRKRFVYFFVEYLRLKSVEGRFDQEWLILTHQLPVSLLKI